MGLPLGIPTTWWEPTDHTTDCHFSLVNTKGSSKKSRHTILYTNKPLAIQPALHSNELPILAFKGFLSLEDVGNDQEQKKLLIIVKKYFSESGDYFTRFQSH